MAFRKLFAVVVGGLLLAPAGAAAQSSFAGQVTDNTGGVLPGVTVEAASPVLIEGSRVAITDGAGNYTIIDLRPGEYTLTFTLPGFGTQVRDQLDLPANVILNIDVAMSVGGIEETITVSGEAPVVDVQQVQRVEVLTREEQESIPTGRSMWSYALLIPGVKVHKPDVGGTAGAQQSTMTGRGLDGRHTTVQIDGLMINTLIDDGQFQAYLNPMLTAETSYTTTGIPAEVQTGGLRMNLIPAEGGNSFSGQFFGTGANSKFQSDNWGPRLGAGGVREAQKLDLVYDFNAAVGGPIFRDRLWFFSTARRNVIDNQVLNSFSRSGEIGIDDNSITSAATRLTWQIDDNNKFSAMFDKVRKRRFHQHDPNRDIDTNSTSWTSPHYDTGTAKWTSTISSRMLAEFGFSLVYEDWDPSNQPEGPVGLNGEIEPITRSVPGGMTPCLVTPCFPPVGSPAANLQLITGDPWYRISEHRDSQLNNFRFGAAEWEENNYNHRWTYTGSLSYVTGSHNFKVGAMITHGHQRKAYTTNGDIRRQHYEAAPHPLGQTVDWINCAHPATQTNRDAGLPCNIRGTPEYVHVANTPSFEKQNLDYNGGFYAQDSWTIDRLTLNIGGRVDFGGASVPELPKVGGRFTRTRIYPGIDNLPAFGPDFSPRFSAAYDLFGDARTALKFGWNRYVRDLGANYPRRYAVARTASERRDWFDQHLTLDANGAWVPSGLDPYGSNWDNIAQDWEIGPLEDENFGDRAPNQVDPDLLREYNQMWTVGIQQELTTGLSLNAEFRRRTFHNTWFGDRRPYTFDAYGALPDGSPNPARQCGPADTGGCWFEFLRPYPYAGTVTIFNIDPDVRTLSGTTDRTIPDGVNPPYNQVYTGFELSVQGRFPNGGQIFGGWSAENQGRFTTHALSQDEGGGASTRFGGEVNGCGDVIARGDNPAELWFCDGTAFPRPYRHEFKVTGTYPFDLPAMGDFQVGWSFQVYPGENQNWGGSTENFFIHRTSSNENFSTYSERFYGQPGQCVDPCVLGERIVPQNLTTTGNGTNSIFVPIVPLDSVKFAGAWTQLDVSLQKVFNVGSWRYDVRVEAFNALNSASEIEFNGSRNGRGLTGAGFQSLSDFERFNRILEGRLVRIGVTARF